MARQTPHIEHKDRTSPQREPAKPAGQGPVELAPQVRPLALQRAIADPRAASPRDMLALQRTAGNRAVSWLIQAKLAVGPAGDKYEQEADRVAERVVSGQLSAVSVAAGDHVQRAITPAVRSDFAVRYAKLVERLKTAKTLSRPADSGEILALQMVALQDGGWLAREVPHLRAQLDTLLQLEAGTLTQSPAKVVKGFRSLSGNYAAASITTFAPAVRGGSSASVPGSGEGGGQFQSPDMQARELAEQGPLMGDPNMIPKARLNIVIQEIDKAFIAHRAGPLPGGVARLDQIVSVFVGPEWYFRRPDRPYTVAEKNLVVETMRAISAVYPHMVIMPGTIVWAKQPTPGQWKDLTNTAPVFWNGQLLKEMDKAQQCGDVSGLVDLAEYSKTAAKGKVSPMFDVGNLKFAIEICADHQSRRARKKLGESSLRKGKGVDVHMVTGAGQVSGLASIVAKPGGIVASSDSDLSTRTGEDVKIVTAPPVKGSSDVTAGTEPTGRALTTVTPFLPQKGVDATKDLVEPLKSQQEAKLLATQVTKRGAANWPVTVFYDARNLP